MKERPILFSGAMVKAILSGTKTQTRRVVKSFKHLVPALNVELDCVKDLDGLPSRLDIAPDNWEVCPYGVPGDRLWVRETFCYEWDERNNRWPDPPTYLYRADNPDVYNIDDSDKSPWTPSIHMPRKASRLTLEVVNVRVERLQEISEQDARAEGINDPLCVEVASLATGRATYSYPAAFGQLWDSINAKRAPWASNPWVWVVEFKRA